MLFLTALELQERVNSVVVHHQLPQMIILFKEDDQDTELEDIPFFDTVKTYLLERDISKLQDIFHGYLAAKLSIVFQDTNFLSLEQITAVIKILLIDPKLESLDSLVFKDRANPYLATIFSRTNNCRAS